MAQKKSRTSQSAKAKKPARPAARPTRKPAKPARASAKTKAAPKAKPRPAKGASTKPARPAAKSATARGKQKPKAASVSAKRTGIPAKPAPAAERPKASAVAAPSPKPVAKPTPVVRPKPVPPPKAKPAAAPAPPAARTPAELARFRSKLLAKKEEIVAMYRNDLRSGQESNDSPTEDIVDRANNAYSRELSYSISDAERALMLQIDEAIARIPAGTFGQCTHCGQPIAAARLEAVPWARLCINCQELLEKGLLAEA